MARVASLLGPWNLEDLAPAQLAQQRRRRCATPVFFSVNPSDYRWGPHVRWLS